MLHSLGTKIQAVTLMAKDESFVKVIRQLQRRRTTNILVKACNNINIPKFSRNRLD